MKINKFFLSLVLGVSLVTAFTSCDKDDDEVKESTKKLEDIISSRKWFLQTVSQITKPPIDLNGDGEIDSKDLDLSPDGVDADDTYYFKKDGTFERNTFNDVSPNEKPHTISVRAKWKIEKDKLIVEESTGETVIYDILPIYVNAPVKYFQVKTTEKKGASEYELIFMYIEKLPKK